MEAERLVPQLPGTTPFGVAASEARSASLTCASALRGGASIGGLLSSSGTSEEGSSAGALYSADARTEQVFFGNFLPVSSGLRYAFMRRCPSAPSELSAADQQRLLQQQRLHMHLLQLERKVSMQERLLCQVQKGGEAPTLLQQQMAASQLPASGCRAENVPSCEDLQCLSMKRDDDAEKNGFAALPRIALFDEKRCLRLAELPSLTLPAQQRDLSIPGGTGGSKGVSSAPLENPTENTTGRNKFAACILKADAADDGTPSTATVYEHSPASDKRVIAPRNKDSSKTVLVADSSVAGVGVSVDCGAASSTKDNSPLGVGVRGEQAGSTCLSLERHATEETREEKEEHTAGSPLWQSRATAKHEANRSEEVTGIVRTTQTSELRSVQQPTERETGVGGAEMSQKDVKEKRDTAEVSFSVGRAGEVEGEKRREVAATVVPASHIEKAGKEKHEGLADATGGRKPEGMRPPDQFFRIKLCAKYMRRTCRKGSRCSYAHAEEELREIPNLWKTKLCSNHKQGKPCPLGTGCPFAHGEEELRCTAEYYKTKLCKFWMREARCEAGEGCRHAHGAAELRQRTYHYGDDGRGGLRVRHQESHQVLEATLGTHSWSKDRSALGTPLMPPVSSRAAAPAVGERSGAVVPMAAKAQEQKAPTRNDGPRARRGQGDDRHAQAKQSPFQPNEREVSASHRRNDAAQGHGANAQQGSPSKIKEKGKVEGERYWTGKGGTGDIRSARGRVKRRGGKGGGFRACESIRAGSTSRERERSASATFTQTLRSGVGSSKRNSRGKESQRRSGDGSYHQHHGGDGRGGARRESFAPPPLNRRRNTVGSHGAQHAPQSYYGNLNKKGQTYYIPGAPSGPDRAEKTALHAQRPRMQYPQQTQMLRHQKFAMHVADSSALNVANANTSALYGLTASINPYGALAACQQQGPYGLSLLSGGPASCDNLQSAAAAAAAVAAIAQQQQQQLEAAAKAVGTPVYQSMPFLAPAPFATFTPSHLSYGAPAHAVPSPFPASHVDAGEAAAGRSCGGAYAVSPYPVYPYSTPGPSALVAEANGGTAAPCVSPSYSPREVSVSCSVCGCDACGPEACVPSNQRGDLQAGGVHADAREAESAPGRYISQGHSLSAAAAGHPVHATGAFVERTTPRYPCQCLPAGGPRRSYREECGTYSDTSASA